MVNCHEILRLRTSETSSRLLMRSTAHVHMIRYVEKLADAKGISQPLEKELTNQRPYDVVILCGTFG